jgi:predicted transcriptional regulator
MAKTAYANVSLLALAHLVEHESATTQEVADALGLNRRSVALALRKLEAIGLVAHVGDKHSGHTYYTTLKRPNETSRIDRMKPSVREEILLFVGRSDHEVSVKEVAAATGASECYVSTVLQQSEQKGLLRRVEHVQRIELSSGAYRMLPIAFYETRNKLR